MARGDRRRAGLPVPSAVRRAAPGRARRRADGRRRARVGRAAARIRRAAMLAGDLAPVARAALVDGEAGLAQFALRPFQPVQPMLADSADDIGDALDELGEASFEYKLDGARIQVHKVDDEVRVYSRASARRDRRRAGDRRRRARDAGALAGARRRGDRRCGPTARRCRFRTRCGGSAGSSTSIALTRDAADHADVLRRAVSRRRSAGRRAADAARGAAGGAERAARNLVPRLVTSDPDAAVGVRAARARRRPRRA